MKRITAPLLAICALYVASVVVASPLKVRTLGTKAQTVEMCPDCKSKLSCAQVGDYTLGFKADLESPKSGITTLDVHVQDAAGNPVETAKVVVTATMPGHGHGQKPLTLKGAGHGRYTAKTIFVMPGAWRAAVAVTPVTGDTVRQSFSFSR
jgi:hypothetical protein